MSGARWSYEGLDGGWGIGNSEYRSFDSSVVFKAGQVSTNRLYIMAEVDGREENENDYLSFSAFLARERVLGARKELRPKKWEIKQARKVRLGLSME